MSIDIRYHCPTEGCVAIIEFMPLEKSTGVIICPRCRKEHVLEVKGAIGAGGTIERCAVCGGEELFIRKNFPQRLGLAIVIVFGLAALYAFTFSVITAWLILASAVGLDLIIYFLTGVVTTCYRCRAEYRGATPNPRHEGFDLATSEKY